MKTNVSGLSVNLRVDSNVVRSVSPIAADCVAMFAKRSGWEGVKEERGRKNFMSDDDSAQTYIILFSVPSHFHPISSYHSHFIVPNTAIKCILAACQKQAQHLIIRLPAPMRFSEMKSMFTETSSSDIDISPTSTRSHLLIAT
jgi:hypothetical protein